MAEKLDLDALERLAINARDGVVRSHGWAGTVEMADLLAKDEAFMLGVSPDAILALIARIRTLESASQPGIDALATAMHHAAIKYASGDLVDFQHEAREFLLASQPGSGEDTARLDYLIDDGAVVDTITNFEGEKRYQLSWPDLGESQNVWYHSARVAIDASRASLDGRREV